MPYETKHHFTDPDTKDIGARIEQQMLDCLAEAKALVPETKEAIKPTVKRLANAVELMCPAALAPAAKRGVAFAYGPRTFGGSIGPVLAFATNFEDAEPFIGQLAWQHFNEACRWAAKIQQTEDVDKPAARAAMCEALRDRDHDAAFKAFVLSIEDPVGFARQVRTLHDESAKFKLVTLVACVGYRACEKVGALAVVCKLPPSLDDQLTAAGA